MSSREVYFKIERLNSKENVVEVKTPVLLSGNVSVSSSDNHRRKCEFVLAEPLPDSWLKDRWRLSSGLKVEDSIEYTPLGIFLPVNPVESETRTGRTTSYQGLDKKQLLIDSIGDVTTSFAESTTLKEVAQIHLDGIGESKRNLSDLPHTLNANYTFAEHRTADHTLMTMVKSFTADFYYDRSGSATLLELPPASQRPVVYSFKNDEASIYTKSKKSFKTDDYYNKVIVVGGNADTDIFRTILADYSEDDITFPVSSLSLPDITNVFEDGGAFARMGQDVTIPEKVDNIRSIVLKLTNTTGFDINPIVLVYSSVDDFNADTWFSPTNERGSATLLVPDNSINSEFEFVFDTPFGALTGEKVFIAIINPSARNLGVSYSSIENYDGGQRYFVSYGGGGGSTNFVPESGDMWFKLGTFSVADNGRRITRYFTEDAATSQDQVDELAKKYLDDGIRIPSTISIDNIPLVDLEVNEIIEKDNVKYEVLSFNIPLSTGTQTIEAGKV